MKKMKKLVGLLLVVCMTTTLFCVTAFADDHKEKTGTYNNSTYTASLDMTYFSITAILRYGKSNEVLAFNGTGYAYCGDVCETVYCNKYAQASSIASTKNPPSTAYSFVNGKASYRIAGTTVASLNVVQ